MWHWLAKIDQKELSTIAGAIIILVQLFSKKSTDGKLNEIHNEVNSNFKQQTAKLENALMQLAEARTQLEAARKEADALKAECLTALKNMVAGVPTTPVIAVPVAAPLAVPFTLTVVPVSPEHKEE